MLGQKLVNLDNYLLMLRSTAARKRLRCSKSGIEPLTSQNLVHACHEPRITGHGPPATKHEPRAMSFEPRTMIHTPRVTIHEPQATSHKPRATSHKPRSTSHDPQATIHKSRSTSHKPRSTSREPRATSNEPQATIHESRATSQESWAPTLNEMATEHYISRAVPVLHLLRNCCTRGQPFILSGLFHTRTLMHWPGKQLKRPKHKTM
jgi:hypothetical protein